jgi:signal transduction histidine kinase
MDEFLTNNREQLVERCKAKVAQRPLRSATPEQLKNGVPLFLDQLIRTLRAERADLPGESLRISGASGGASSDPSEMSATATAHGRQLLDLGYTVDQVVHDYGDLCQAITDLAEERDAPFSVPEFRTLNRCLDNAIADAVTAFSAERDVAQSLRAATQSNERLGFLLHELRNALQSANLALTALASGQLPVTGATGGVLKRSLATLASLVKHALDEVRVDAHQAPPGISGAEFIADAGSAAMLDAHARGCSFAVRHIDGDLHVEGDRQLLMGALMNLLQNAFKFTHAQTEVSLNAFASDDGAVLIEVADHCGGLPPGFEASLFRPFARGLQDKSGLGLGLCIAQANVEGAGGTLAVRNLPGTGCVFTIRLARHAA